MGASMTWTDASSGASSAGAPPSGTMATMDTAREAVEAARAYANIKRSLAASSIDDVEAYRTGKNTFVEETTAKARAWRASVGPSLG